MGREAVAAVVAEVVHAYAGDGMGAEGGECGAPQADAIAVVVIDIAAS